MGDVAAVAAEVCRASEDARVARALDALSGALEPGSIVPLDRVKELYVRAVLRVHGGRKAEAAEALGVSRYTLYRWLKYGVERGGRAAVAR